MTAAPLISTIIPVFNGERFLAEAVDSIRGQRYPELEIIVVDDGSTDGTAEVARRLGDPVRYESQANRGAPAARNRGLELARGELIAFLDADDVWTPDKLGLQASRLLAEPELELAIGMTQLMRFVEGADGSAAYQPMGEAGLIPSLGSALFRREAFDRLGRLDESLRMDDDVDWFLRALENDVRMAVVPRVVQYYRRHERNITNARGVDIRFFLVAIKKSLERRRAGGGKVRALGRWPAGQTHGDG